MNENTPFAGTMVPMPFYRRNRHVESIMIEIRRDLIMDEGSGELLTSAGKVFESIREMAEAALRR